jgi:hypothetical protein
MMRGWLDRRSILILAGCGGAALLLGGCSTEVSRTVWPDIGFGHEAPIGLSVLSVSFAGAAGKSDIQPPAHDIEFALPVSPIDTMQRWSQQRLVAAGGSGMATVTVTEHRFAEVPLDTTTGVQGLFTNDQSERYEGTLACRVDITGNAQGNGYVEARVNASRTVPEDFNVNQREQKLYDMISDMVNALDQRLEQQIRGNLPQFLA